LLPFLISSRRRHTSFSRDWSSDVCSSDLRPVSTTTWPLVRVPMMAWSYDGPTRNVSEVDPIRLENGKMAVMGCVWSPAATVPLDVPPGRRLMESVPAVILFAFRFGMRSLWNVPLVTLAAARSTSRAMESWPLTILLASRFGMRLLLNVPEMTLLASSPGIWLVSSTPTMSVGVWVWEALAYTP